MAKYSSGQRDTIEIDDTLDGRVWVFVCYMGGSTSEISDSASLAANKIVAELRKYNCVSPEEAAAILEIAARYDSSRVRVA